MKNIKILLACDLIYKSDCGSSEMISLEEEYWHKNIMKHLNDFNFLSNCNLEFQSEAHLNISNAPKYPRIAENIASNYDLYDAFIVICDIHLSNYLCPMLSFALTNLGKPVFVISPKESIHGRLSGGIDVDSELRDNLIGDITSAIWFLTESKIEWFGVYFLCRHTVYNPTYVIGYNSRAYERNWQFLGKMFQQLIVDVEGLNTYQERCKPFALKSNELVLKNNFVYNDIYSKTLMPFDNHLNHDLEYIKEKKYKAVRLLTEHFSFIGDLDSPFSKETVNFFDYCKENRIAVIVVKDPTAFSEFCNYQIAEQIQKYGGVPVNLLSDCSLIKLAWLIGQGLEYEGLCNEMKRNIKGEFGRFIVV